MEWHMDNDNQVESTLVEAKRHFLNVKIDDDTPFEHYSLEEEFTKSRKNHQAYVYLSLLGALAFSVFLAWLVVVILDATRTVNPAVIDNFQELRLRDVFNAARQNEQTLANLNREIAGLNDELKLKVEQVRSETQAAIQLLSQRRMTAQQRITERSNLLSQQNTQIRELEREYKAKITELEDKKKEIEANIQSYQQRLSQADQKRQMILRSSEEVSQRQTAVLESSYNERLKQLETQSRDSLQAERQFHEEYVKLLQERHEEEIKATILRYNPIVEEAEILSILQLQLDDSIQRGEFIPLLEREGVWTRSDYNLVNLRFEQLMSLWERLRAVPYENSVPPILDQLKRFSLLTLGKMDELQQKIAQRLEQKNDKIEELEGVIVSRNEKITQLNDEISYRERVLTAFADSLAENGFVYRILSPQSIQLRLKTGVDVQVGQQITARLNQDNIATLEIIRTDDGIWARTLNLVRPNRPVRLLDRVVIPPTAP